MQARAVRPGSLTPRTERSPPCPSTLTSRAADVYGDATGQEEVADVFRASFSDNLRATVDRYDTTGDEVTDPFDTDSGSPYALEECANGSTSRPCSWP